MTEFGGAFATMNTFTYTMHAHMGPLNWRSPQMHQYNQLILSAQLLNVSGLLVSISQRTSSYPQSTIRLQVCRANDPAPLLAATAAKSIAVNFLAPGTEAHSASASTTPPSTMVANTAFVSTTPVNMATTRQSANSAFSNHSPNTSLFGLEEMCLMSVFD